MAWKAFPYFRGAVDTDRTFFPKDFKVAAASSSKVERFSRKKSLSARGMGWPTRNTPLNMRMSSGNMKERPEGRNEGCGEIEVS